MITMIVYLQVSRKNEGEGALVGVLVRADRRGFRGLNGTISGRIQFQGG